MGAQEVRETIEEYVEVLLARGDYGRLVAEDVELSIAGTDQSARGASEAEEAIRFFHEIAFDAQPELVNTIVGDRGAAVEFMFVGTHVGEFSGVAPTARTVRVPYFVFYDVNGGRITALRIYMPLDQLVAQVQRGSGADAATTAR